MVDFVYVVVIQWILIVKCRRSSFGEDNYTPLFVGDVDIFS